MNILLLLSTTLIALNILNASANNNFANFKIRSMFNIKHAYCSIKTNGVKGLNNRKSAFSGSGGGVSSTNSLLFLENGTNEISIEIGALDWFSEEKNKTGSKGKFSSNSSCKMELTRFNKIKNEVITDIEVNIDKNGMPEGRSNDVKLVGKKILAEQVEPDHIDVNYYNDLFFPKGMELYEFKKEIVINDIPEWQWVNATPYINNNDQLTKLREAYIEMAGIINSRNREKLKKFDQIALHAWSTTTGESEDDILASQYPQDKLEGGKAKIEPIVWDNYEVRVMNKGRIVQLYNKSKPTYSPLNYYYVDEDGDKMMGFFAPMFSLINGKFVPVI